MRIKKYLMIGLSCLLIFATFPLTTFAETESNENANEDTNESVNENNNEDSNKDNNEDSNEKNNENSNEDSDEDNNENADEDDEDTDNDSSELNDKPGKYKSKDEVVYGKLDANGKVNNMYVVNSFFIDNPGEIVDHGKYTNVRNLTDLTDVEIVGNDEVHFEADDEFYYQGELDFQTLPWNIDITYLLDDQEVNPDNLAGKSGELEIRIETTQNENIDPVFFEYYLLQISLTFDPLLFHDIQAPEGTEANEGKNKLVSFNGMPGTEDVMIVSTRVENLEMEPIEIAAVPANIAIEDPDTDDLTDEIKVLADAIHDINVGVGDLQGGVSSLRSGAAELTNGSESYKNGLNELNNSSGDLVSGSSEILAALNQITNELANAPEMPDLGEIEELPGGLREMAKQIREFAATFDQLKKDINEIPEPTLSEEQINEIYTVLEENEIEPHIAEAVGQLEGNYYAAQTIKELSKEFPEQLEGIIASLADNVDSLATGIEEALGNLDQLDQIDELQSGLSTLADEYQTFHNGLVTYTEGVNSITVSYGDLNSGTKGLLDGAIGLEGGVNELKDGTQELAEETDDLPDQIKTEIQKFMDEFDYSDYKPTSFVSSENENVSVVQFVLETESIETAEPEEEPEVEEEKQGLWNMFLDLFK